MRSTIQVISILLMGLASLQGSVPNAAVRTPFQEFYRIYVSHNKADFLRMSITLTTRDSVSRNLVSNANFELKASRGRYAYTYDSMQIVQGFLMNLNIDQRAKVIGLAPPDKFKGFFPVPLMENDFRNNALASSSIVQQSSSLWTLKFVFKPGGYYSIYEVNYDPVSLMVGSQKITYRDEGGTVIETVITSWGHNSNPFDTQVFDEYVFVQNAAETYIPMPAYSTYRIVDGMLKD
jgi:hypothetical protein